MVDNEVHSSRSDGKDILISLDVKTTPEELYEAITTQKGLAGWFTPQTKAESKVGTALEFKFPQATDLKFRVDELERDRSVVWSNVQTIPDWESTRIKFRITGRGDITNLQFSQTGLPPGYKDHSAFSYFWAQYMRSLKLLVETGEGEPYGSAGSRLAGTTPQKV